MYGTRPEIEPGERVYLVADNRLWGYAPLLQLQGADRADGHQRSFGFWDLVRTGGAAAVTIPEAVKGFRGWQDWWWDRSAEAPFPRWRWP